MQTTGYAPPADPTSVFGRRVVAWLIDAAIGLVIIIIAFAALAESRDFATAAEAERVCDVINNSDGSHVCINADTTVILAEGGDIGTVLLVALIYALATQVVLPTITGASPGKLMTGLRVVDRNTFAKAGFGKHIVRWVLWVVEGSLCGPLIAGIVALSSKGHRRVGDMAAGTLVVDRKHLDLPVAVPGANDLPAMASGPAPYAAPTAPPAPPVTAPAPVMPPAPAAPPAPPVTPPPPTAPAAPPVTPPPPTAPAAPPVTAPAPEPPAPEPPAPEPPAPEPAGRPGIDAPQWDEARDTYIQWDPELEEWMEWDEAGGRWIPISQ